MSKNDGKATEKLVGKALTALLGNKAVMTRLYDTKSSAFYLPPSPADFMGIFKGGIPVLIEAKSSDEHLSFTDCRVKDYVVPTQYAYHKMWLRMGGVSVFVFHSLMSEEVEVWDGEQVLRSYKHGWILSDEPEEVLAPVVKKVADSLVRCVGHFKGEFPKL